MTRVSYQWPGDDVKARFLLDFFVLAAVMNGVSSDYTHTQSRGLTHVQNPQQSNLVNYTMRSEPGVGYYNDHAFMRSAIDKVLSWIFNTHNEEEKSLDQGRFKFKFGGGFMARRRLMFALLPIMYKMGVMTTLLSGLTILVLKGLTIGVILLILAFGNYFAKLPKYSHQSAQPIHFHLHSPDKHKFSSYPGYELEPWDRTLEERMPSSYFADLERESYRRNLMDHSEAMFNYRLHRL